MHWPITVTLISAVHDGHGHTELNDVRVYTLFLSIPTASSLIDAQLQHRTKKESPQIIDDTAPSRHTLIIYAKSELEPRYGGTSIIKTGSTC